MTDEMQEAEVHPMDVAAIEAIAQGWCEPETIRQEMDVVLATAIARPVSRLLRNWYDTAAQNARNTDYYRGLVVEIGAMFGNVAYVSDDGSVQEDVLCAKVPELVRARLGASNDMLAALEYLVGECDKDMDDDYNPHAAPLARAYAVIAKAKGDG